MKRGPQSSIDPGTKLRPKFEKLEFIQSEDPFVTHFTTKIRETSKTNCMLQDKEINLINVTTPLVLPIMHRRLEHIETRNQYIDLFSNYLDCFLTTNTNFEDLQTAYLIHILNHIYKSKSLVSKNSQQEEPSRDQGFNPSRVLILVPYKKNAKRIIEIVADIHCKGKKKKMGKNSRKKFVEMFEEAEDVRVI